MSKVNGKTSFEGFEDSVGRGGTECLYSRALHFKSKRGTDTSDLGLKGLVSSMDQWTHG